MTIKGILITAVLLIFSFISISQNKFIYNVKGSGTVTFISTKSGQEILFNTPSLKSKFSNFVSLPRDSSYPSSITDGFSCRDEKNQTWSFYSVVIGSNKFFILSNDLNTIQVEYASNKIKDEEIYYVFEKIKYKK